MGGVAERRAVARWVRFKWAEAKSHRGGEAASGGWRKRKLPNHREEEAAAIPPHLFIIYLLSVSSPKMQRLRQPPSTGPGLDHIGRV